MTYLWPLYPPKPGALVCAGFKYELPPLQPHQTAIRLELRFAVVWAVRQGDSLLCKDGSLLPFATVHAAGRTLLGNPDPYGPGMDSESAACDTNPFSQAYRRAIWQRAAEESQAQLAALLACSHT